MKHIKLFEEIKIDWEEFPKHENIHELSPRERKILTDLVGKYYLNRFTIRVEDHYYYCSKNNYYNMFDGFNGLKDYILSKYYLDNDNMEELLELLRNSELDPSYEDNWIIRWSSYNGNVEIVRHLLNDTRVDPSDLNNMSITWASNNSHKEIVKLLLNDKRVRDKLTDEQINKYTNEIS